MKNTLTLVLIALSFTGFGQKNPTEEAQPIVAEGKLLYKLEMASWVGTDLFLEKYKDLDNIGGYFSYIENDSAKCIFFSNVETPKVIGTIAFDTTYNERKAKISLTERNFSQTESDLFQIRKVTLEALNTNTDGFFKFYENTQPNIIPLINGDDKKVYIITGTQETDIVIFGNDYLLTFDKDNKLVAQKQLHQNILPIKYGNSDAEENVVGAMHNHSPETGDFITATDICTVMLYEEFTKWKSYNVVSEKYLNIWNCETDQLVVVSMNIMDNIEKDQEKRNKKKKKDE